MGKQNNNHARSGYILAAVMMVLALASLIVVQLATRSSVYNFFVPIAADHEKARILALSAVTCALNQLAMKDQNVFKEDEEKEKVKVPQQDPTERLRKFMLNLLLIQNRWQTYSIKKGDLQGEIGLYVSCEDGKIPLNTLIDIKTRSFAKIEKPAVVKVQEAFEYLFQKMSELKKGKNAFVALQNALKTCTYGIVSVEELLVLEDLSYMRDSLYVPFPSDGQKQGIALTDIFTIYGKAPSINPWLFSSSLKILYDVKDEQKKEKKEYEALVKGIDFSKTSVSQEWDNSLKKLYNKSYTALPEKIVGLLSGQCDPSFFMVLCYGKVGAIEQRVCAYIERIGKEDTEIFKVQKMYWL